MNPQFQVDETLVVFAFRYALGRRSTAPGIMVDYIVKHWDQFQGWTQRQIQQEIGRAIETKRAGDDCDIEEWRKVLKLTGYDCPVCGRPLYICVCSHEDL